MHHSGAMQRCDLYSTDNIRIEFKCFIRCSARVMPQSFYFHHHFTINCMACTVLNYIREVYSIKWFFMFLYKWLMHHIKNQGSVLDFYVEYSKRNVRNSNKMRSTRSRKLTFGMCTAFWCGTRHSFLDGGLFAVFFYSVLANYTVYFDSDIANGIKETFYPECSAPCRSLLISSRPSNQV